jgi:hypothetical protein
MIKQIAPVAQTQYFPRVLNRGLAQVRQIQAKLKATGSVTLPKTGILWSSTTREPATVRISRWIE